MKIKKGIFRIYIVLSCLWSALFLLGIFPGGVWHWDLYARMFSGDELFHLIMASLPIPLYFILKWIVKGFE